MTASATKTATATTTTTINDDRDYVDDDDDDDDGRRRRPTAIRTGCDDGGERPTPIVADEEVGEIRLYPFFLAFFLFLSLFSHLVGDYHDPEVGNPSCGRCEAQLRKGPSSCGSEHRVAEATFELRKQGNPVAEAVQPSCGSCAAQLRKRTFASCGSQRPVAEATYPVAEAKA